MGGVFIVRQYRGRANGQDVRAEAERSTLFSGIPLFLFLLSFIILSTFLCFSPARAE